MLKKILNLPDGIIGVEAHKKVTKEDYETVIYPLLHEAYSAGQKVKFLYVFTPDFTEFTFGSAIDDMKIGLKYFWLFEKCAVVTDLAWIQKTVQFTVPFTPFPVNFFPNKDQNLAIEWLQKPANTSNIKTSFLAEKGVLIVEPQKHLTIEDFDRLAMIIDPWIQQNHELHGLVIHTKNFPGWENFGSFLRHFQFVKKHHEHIKRVALSTDSSLSTLVPKLAAHFVKAEIKIFSFSQINEATKWAGNGQELYGDMH